MDEPPDHEEPDREDGKAPGKPPKPVLEPRNKPKTPVHTAGFPSPTGPGMGTSGVARPTHERNSPQKTPADEKKDRMAAMLQKSDEQMAKSIQGLENEHKRDRERLAEEYENRPEDEKRKAMDDLQEKQQEQMDLTIENLNRNKELGAERIRLTEEFNKAHDGKSMGRDGR
ncbi:hypothetical protein ACFSSA_13475 [Luteolibacter algae]|uniref:Uncharacterized protein n=1 Tax=Luteolibacter algae TaxID=454151 RepID=A0ABW5DB20_9BACT